MSEFEQNIPDDFWRDAFEKAAETPPPRVWDAIERRLDEDEGTAILPLWGRGLASSRSFVWGIGLAASVALILVGWWVSRTISAGSNVVSDQQPDGPAASIAATSPASDGRLSKAPLQVTARQPSALGSRAQESVVLRQKSVSQPVGDQFTEPTESIVAPSTDKLLVLPPAVRPVQSSLALTAPALTLAAGEQQATDAEAISMVRQPMAVSSFRVDMAKNNRMALTDNIPDVALSAVTASSTAQLPAAGAQSVSFDPLAPSAVRLRSSSSIQRIVWFHPAESATEPLSVRPKRDPRDVWASASLMPGAFNPSVAVRSPQATFSNSNALSNSSVSQPSVNSRANFSVAYQAGAGIQLTERWSVESGVGYMAGRSTVESPVQASVASFQAVGIKGSVQPATLYIDALRSSLASQPSAVANSVASLDYTGVRSQYAVPGNYNSQLRQSLTNDYQFIQVPVQVGYQLRPRKRLSLALLGGFLSNIFVRNTVGNELVVTAKDGVYRPVSWAATLGARFRYRPSRQWSASLAGVYQPSLGPGTRPGSLVQTHPTSTGMSFGIDYHF